jgi:branched-chain amino acid transport system substrate-binding protein
LGSLIWRILVVRLSRRSLLALAAGASLTRPARADAEPIMAGVSGPLTGPNAQYGAQWKRGFDLALESINGGGGIGGRPIAYQFEDSQSDPRQSVAIAQKFVNDPRIVIELGDFSSPASMAASPIYQRGKLVQFGFTNSHPDFTKGGDYMWSNSNNQAEEQPKLAEYAVKELGMKRPAVLHLNTDWGRTSKDIFVPSATALGAAVAAVEAFMPNEQDFRPTLVRVRDANADGLVLISYYADSAQIVRQARDFGLKQTIAAASSNYSPKFIELGGPAVNGVFLMSSFFPDEPRPEVQQFVTSYRAHYAADPDQFNAIAYDSMVLFGELCKQFGPTRDAVHEGLAKIKDVPSVIYGRLTFDPVTRRVPHPVYKYLLVKNDAFTLWDGTPPAHASL